MSMRCSLTSIIRRHFDRQGRLLREILETNETVCVYLTPAHLQEKAATARSSCRGLYQTKNPQHKNRAVATC